jgi:hypothetical protein
VVTTNFLCVFLFAGQGRGPEMNVLICIFFGFFEVVVIIVLVKGLKTVIRDNKTKKYGIECYGIVRDIIITGSYENDHPEYKAVIEFLNPENYQIQTLEEIVGFDYNKYPINSYVLCKYYEGDVNIEMVVQNSEVPGDVLKLIVPEELPQDDLDYEMDPNNMQ